MMRAFAVFEVDEGAARVANMEIFANLDAAVAAIRRIDDSGVQKFADRVFRHFTANPKTQDGMRCSYMNGASEFVINVGLFDIQGAMLS